MKKVLFMSKLQAEDITPEPKHKAAIISINEPYNQAAKLHPAWEKKLILYFHDIDGPISEQLIIINKDGSHEEKDYVHFTEEHAQKILRFLEEIRNLNILVVHCHAGISRSAAIAKFVAEKFDLPFNHEYSLYNKYMYKILKHEDFGNNLINNGGIDYEKRN